MTGIAFRIGGITVSWYGILIAAGALAALGVAFIEARRRGETASNVITLALITIPLGIIGARLYHVIDQWSYYMQNPGMIIGGRGLGIFGAIIGGALGLIIYTRWKKLGTLRWLDIFAPGLILAQAIGRWGNFFNQELYGYPTDLPGVCKSTRLTVWRATSRSAIFTPCFSTSPSGTYSDSLGLWWWGANCLPACATAIFSSCTSSTTASAVSSWRV